MKFLNKIVALIITVVMVAAVAIGLGVIFSVKNVNVTLLSYSYESDSDGAKTEIAKFKKDISAKVRGTLLVRVNEKSVEEILDGENYVLESFEKIYPCTLNVTVKERCEAYAVETLAGYAIYDDEGEFLRNDENYYNKLDNAPNVLIKGETAAEKIKSVAKVGAIFKEKFSSLRSTIESVYINEATSNLEVDKLTFELRCGVSIEVQNYTAFTDKKLEAGHNLYAKLSDEQKLSGKIYCFETADGTVSATFNKNA